jgi:hypothetical protein
MYDDLISCAIWNKSDSNDLYILNLNDCEYLISNYSQHLISFPEYICIDCIDDFNSDIDDIFRFNDSMHLYIDI